VDIGLFERPLGLFNTDYPAQTDCNSRQSRLVAAQEARFRLVR